MTTHEANQPVDEPAIEVVAPAHAAADTRAPWYRRAGAAFARFYRTRPFVGGLLTVLSGFALFASSQLDLGNIHLQFGVQGFQATVIPIVMVLLGVLVWAMPVHRVFYGVIALVLAVYSLLGVNLGGFFIGMILGIVGGVVSVSWIPREEREAAARAKSAARDDADAVTAEAAADDEDDYSLVPGLADAQPGPPTLTLHTVETVGTDAPSTGPRPFLVAPAETGEQPADEDPAGTVADPADEDPAGTTTDEGPADPADEDPAARGARRSRRARRLTRASGAAVVAVCSAAGLGVLNAAQAPTAQAESIALPTFLQWLVPGSSDEGTGDPTADAAEDTAASGTPSGTPTGTQGTETGSEGAGASPSSAATTGSATQASDGTDGSGAAASTTPSQDATTPAAGEPSSSPTPTSPLPAATTPAPQLEATSDQPVAPALTSHLAAADMQLTWSFYAGNVKLTRADGSTVEVMKFTADKAVMNDFSLDVPNGDGHGLLTTSSKVTNTGHVVVYATKFSGELLGIPLTFTPDSPPPSLIPLPSLSDPEIELVTTTSDRSTWADAHQKIY